MRRWLESLASSLASICVADAAAAILRGHGEIQQVQPRPMQLIDHEADHAVFVLGDHADAVALPQAANEILFAPGKLEPVDSIWSTSAMSRRIIQRMWTRNCSCCCGFISASCLSATTDQQWRLIAIPASF